MPHVRFNPLFQNRDPHEFKSLGILGSDTTYSISNLLLFFQHDKWADLLKKITFLIKLKNCKHKLFFAGIGRNSIHYNNEPWNSCFHFRWTINKMGRRLQVWRPWKCSCEFILSWVFKYCISMLYLSLLEDFSENPQKFFHFNRCNQWKKIISWGSFRDYLTIKHIFVT